MRTMILVRLIPMTDLLNELRRSNLGIDIQKRGTEVRKLLMAGFGGTIQKNGWDVEDLLQEVYLGILTRNKGACPWDESKSSFGHYVYMVCRCVVANYGRKQGRIRREQVGVLDADGVEVDAGELAIDVDSGSTLESRDYLSKNLDDIDYNVLLGLMEGRSRGSIRKDSGLDVKDYDQSVEEIRELVRELFNP